MGENNFKCVILDFGELGEPNIQHVERKKVDIDIQGAKYYYWQDEMEKLNKFEQKYIMGIDPYTDEGNNKGSNKPSSKGSD
jgi:hypothetical protein